MENWRNWSMDEYKNIMKVSALILCTNKIYWAVGKAPTVQTRHTKWQWQSTCTWLSSCSLAADTPLTTCNTCSNTPYEFWTISHSTLRLSIEAIISFILLHRRDVSRNKAPDTNTEYRFMKIKFPSQCLFYPQEEEHFTRALVGTISPK